MLRCGHVPQPFRDSWGGFCYSPGVSGAAPRRSVAGRLRGGKGRRVRHAQGDPAISNKVFVGNLSFDVTREELIQAFSAAGKVVDAKVPTDRETGRPRGFAFVEFVDDEAAEKSISLMNGRDLKGRPLRVNAAENRPPRPPGAGGPGGFRPPGAGPGYGGGYRPGGAPPYSAGPVPESFEQFPVDDRGRPFKSKGSRRNLRRRKRGFD
jgi:cold-inducible RNA-binding protein